MATRSFRDITKALQGVFSDTKSPLSLPTETRRLLQTFVDEHDGLSEEESIRANTEIKTLWDKYVGENSQKQDLFMGVLKELRPAIIRDSNIVYWAVKAAAVIQSTGHTKTALDDARDFLLGALVFDDDDPHAAQKAKAASRICKSLLDTYISRSPTLTESDSSVAADNALVVQQVEDVLVAFGRKRPKDVFNLIDDILIATESRLQALTLLNSFLRHQTPHLYLVINTPLVEHLLKCLINDTSTTILSVALTSLVMLCPHIPGSLAAYLPRLFLIYSRILCWEKFSELSTEAERDIVTDDRITRNEETEDSDEEIQDVGIDTTWQRARPQEGTIEAATPELLTYFTYLYGLYPLNFMSYIRKPRRFLKNVDFPGADGFDLDQAVIRARTDQFRQMYLIHPNFYHLTIEEELEDPKWAQMDPADVVGQCQALCTYSKLPVQNTSPPTAVKLQNLRPMPPLVPSTNVAARSQLSPAASHASLRSGSSWRDTHSTAVSVPAKGDSPRSRPQSVSYDPEIHTEQLPPSITKIPVESEPQDNIAYLQREITLLRNELNFERWHKAQYSEHISQIMRRNVKEATVEAETLNLINANRALKRQIEQLQKARETTIKDSALTRKQANALETNMTERFHKLKLEQETWQADADELRRLRSEMKRYRELLVSTEARDLNKSLQLQLAQRDLDELGNIQTQLEQASLRLHEYEHREFEFETALRERDIFKAENEALLARLGNDDRLGGVPDGKVSTSARARRRSSDPMISLLVPQASSGQVQTRSSRSKTVSSKSPVVPGSVRHQDK